MKPIWKQRTRIATTPAPRTPTLQFSPYAWSKLIYLRDRGPSEIGGFGIASQGDLLYVEDFALVQQIASPFSVELNDAAVADYFERQVEVGRRPAEFSRLWIHTHPGSSAEPSSLDEATFARVFGDCDFAVMFILAQEGQCYARMQFNVGPRGSVQLDVEIDYARPFAATDHTAWDEEYSASVTLAVPALEPPGAVLRRCAMDAVSHERP
jgi:proteasome lid subunit RPN8/RPN11